MIIQELQNCIKDKPCLLGMMKACQEEVPTSVGMSHVASLTMLQNWEKHCNMLQAVTSCYKLTLLCVARVL